MGEGAARIPAIDLYALLREIPCGSWVAISLRRYRVLAYGSDMQQVLEEAKTHGENESVLTIVSKSATFFYTPTTPN
jgi:hypothetical protein